MELAKNQIEPRRVFGFGILAQGQVNHGYLRAKNAGHQKGVNDM